MRSLLAVAVMAFAGIGCGSSALPGDAALDLGVTMPDLATPDLATADLAILGLAMPDLAMADLAHILPANF